MYSAGVLTVLTTHGLNGRDGKTSVVTTATKIMAVNFIYKCWIAGNVLNSLYVITV